MDEFFVRFSLQRMAGCLPENEFDSYKRVGAGLSEIEKFTAECDAHQAQQAQELLQKYAGAIDKIRGKSIMFIGDSITADRLGYRGIITKTAELSAQSLAFSGATSCDMHRFLHESCMSAEIASIMIGANDAFYVGADNKHEIVGKQEYRRNIAGILDTCTKKCEKTIIMTVPTLHEARWSAGGCDDFKINSNQNIDIYCDIVREEAARYNAALVDINAELKKHDENEVMSEDGIHLSPMGQRVLADLWLATILK